MPTKLPKVESASDIINNNPSVTGTSHSEIINKVLQERAHREEGSTVAGLPSKGEGVTEPGQGNPTRASILRGKKEENKGTASEYVRLLVRAYED
jgi:hypothetical protein